MVEPGYDELDIKERALCNESNIKPRDYLALKVKLTTEHKKNQAVIEKLVKEGGK